MRERGYARWPLPQTTVGVAIFFFRLPLLKKRRASSPGKTPGGVMTAQKFHRLPAVVAITGLSRSTIYSRVKALSFPSPVPLGSPRIVGWIESEIAQWQAAQIRAARPDAIEPAAV